MYQEAVRRLCHPSESRHVRKVAHLLAQALSPLSCLTVQQDVESPIVRDDRVQTRAAVDHVFHPVGCSDGVVPIAAEDLLPSSRKVHHTSEPTSVNAVGQRA